MGVCSMSIETSQEPTPSVIAGDRSLSSSRPYSSISACLAYSVSFVTHAVILVGLALGVTKGIQSDNVVVSVSNATYSPDDVVELNSDFSIKSAPPVSEESLPSIAESEFASAAPIQIELPVIEQELGANNASLQGELAKATARDSLKKKGLSLNGSGSSFFGIESTGEKFVFIVDSSRSMEGKRWEHANKELFRSIAELGPDQKFFVICFDFAARPAFDLLPSNIKFLSSSNNSRRRIRQWIQGLGLGSNTRPAEALRLALALQPDAIYLLSDGELEDDSYEMLALINHDVSTGKAIVPIHTISLYSTSGRELLELIASNNGGKFVNVDK
jgi:von Willebrand factor type A domain